jgi:hypothetical protein
MERAQSIATSEATKESENERKLEQEEAIRVLLLFEQMEQQEAIRALRLELSEAQRLSQKLPRAPPRRGHSLY